MDEEIERAAELQREKMMAGMKKNKGMKGVSDFSVAYDSKGKVMPLKKLNCDRLPNNGNKPLEAIRTDLNIAASR